MKNKKRLLVIQRINAYLYSGGAFNPELADHDAVRDLLIDCREALIGNAKFQATNLPLAPSSRL